MSRAKPVVTATHVLVLATGTYLQIETAPGGKHDFLLPDRDSVAGLKARVKEMRETAKRWQRQADVLDAGLKFELAKAVTLKPKT